LLFKEHSSPDMIVELHLLERQTRSVTTNSNEIHMQQ
jgi:hypothetical protein